MLFPGRSDGSGSPPLGELAHVFMPIALPFLYTGMLLNFLFFFFVYRVDRAAETRVMKLLTLSLTLSDFLLAMGQSIQVLYVLFAEI